MKRRTLLGGSLVVAMTLVVPVGAVAQESIGWWYESANPEQQRFIRDLIVAPFNESHLSYQLSVDFRGIELDKQVRLALLSGSGPDIVYTAGPSYVAPMIQAGQLTPLDDFARQYGWEGRILPVFLEMGKYDGKPYALPKTYETLGLFYNKVLFEERGWSAPTSVEALEAIADAILGEKIIPFGGGQCALATSQ